MGPCPFHEKDMLIFHFIFFLIIIIISTLTKLVVLLLLLFLKTFVDNLVYDFLGEYSIFPRTLNIFSSLFTYLNITI